MKPLLYTFRVLLTGIYLMRTGQLEANLLRLNEEAKLPYIDELVAQKVSGSEHQVLRDEDVSFFESEFQRLLTVLESEAAKTSLTSAPSTRLGLHEFLLRLRLKR